MNLNELKIITDSDPIDLVDNSIKLESADFEKVEVYFRALEANLITKITEFRKGFIFGSIAWLTSFKILDALAECDNVQIVVQKEDFLRPDLNIQDENDWKVKLRMKYDKLKFKHDRYDMIYPINQLSVLGDPTVDPIRCVGNHNRDKKSAFPRAHNKFIVFCDLIKESTEETRLNSEPIYQPVSAWTGSFNLTWNAVNSFENAIYLEDRRRINPAISSFLKEHHQIFALSEKIDWETDWVEPEFRIGT